MITASIMKELNRIRTHIFNNNFKFNLVKFNLVCGNLFLMPFRNHLQISLLTLSELKRIN